MEEQSEVRKQPRLLEKLKSKNYIPMKSSMACALQTSHDCRCQGKGFLVGQRGAYLGAELCECVKECQLCQGLARIPKNGRLVSCCEPEPQRMVSSLNSAKIPAKYSRVTLESFRNFSGNGQKVLNHVTNFVNEFRPRGTKGLILGGQVGVGKTYLLAAIGKELAKRFQVRFVDFFQLLAELKAGFSKGQSEMELIAPLVEVEVLLIDELGKGRNTEWELTILDQIVLGRYNTQKNIFATTNYSFTNTFKRNSGGIDLESEPSSQMGNFTVDSNLSLEQRVGPRIFSRMYEMTNYIEITGKDFRRR